MSRLCVLFASALFLAAAAPQKTAKELVEYIQHAQKLGLKDNKIRQNAITAGWDKNQVEQAFVILRFLTTNGAGLKLDGEKDEPAEVGYRIGAGDVLQIVVWKEPDASVPSAIVRPDGKITVPLLQEVSVVGLTPLELGKLLTEKLQKFIRDAEVTVVAREINSRKVYLVGAVKREGPLMLQGNMTVLQAITEAGGLTDYAKRKKIHVLRTDNGTATRFPFDYEAVIQGKNMEQNILLGPNDMIVVPQ
jgi:polysaccharide export outer membrane protein